MAEGVGPKAHIISKVELTISYRRTHETDYSCLVLINQHILLMCNTFLQIYTNFYEDL